MSQIATFSRHETFHPRYGWLKKGVDLIDRNPSAFTDADVHMELGVGKNWRTRSGIGAKHLA
jgi:hypothetical protein